MNEFYIYRHTFANGAVYIGKGKGLRAYSLVRKRLPKWWATYVKHGAPNIEILEGGLDDAQALAAEIKMIAELRLSDVNLCNLTDGGEGLSGYVVSEQTREKLRAANVGRVRSPETRAKIKAAKSEVSDATRSKIRTALLGKKHSSETKLKRARSLTGRAVSQETRIKLAEQAGWTHNADAKKKMSAAKIGKTGNLCPSSKPVLCSNGLRFYGTFDAQKWLRNNGFEKAHASRVAAVCRGERNKAYGLIWRYE